VRTAANWGLGWVRTSWFFHTFHKFTGNIGAFEPHNALLRTAETKQIDAPVPHDPLIDEREFLVYVRKDLTQI
jgi:hypothetical protein